MALTIDLAAAARTISDEEFHAWAVDHSVFISSVMAELAEERKAVAAALEGLGFRVRWFEAFGGRDDPADAAYVSEVEASDIYLGLLGDEYGAMLPSGFSPTHEEYLAGKSAGKRVSFWVRGEDSSRSGHARNFLSEVRVFHVTGRFDGVDDLPAKVELRLREMAADDLSPWVKVGDAIVRASSITHRGGELTVEARVRDQRVLRALDELSGGGGGFGTPSEAPVTYSNRSGTAGASPTSL